MLRASFPERLLVNAPQSYTAHGCDATTDAIKSRSQAQKNYP